MVVNKYEITIDNFNGPLDLLLHLIKESKMDILDIKLEVIIDGYLTYIKEMQNMSLDIASSYLVMASELIEIKSRMLLPVNQEIEQEEDPKERLINKLIEYQKYKDLTSQFKMLEYERANYYTKIPSSLMEYINEDVIVNSPTMKVEDLMLAFKKFLERREEDKPIPTTITKKELNVDEYERKIRERLKITKKVNFFDLFECKSREYIIVTFLAILELASKREIRLVQENNFDNIICEAI